jgi:isopropylmalate/homocitrate/citramalate synthase
MLIVTLWAFQTSLSKSDENKVGMVRQLEHFRVNILEAGFPPRQLSRTAIIYAAQPA